MSSTDTKPSPMKFADGADGAIPLRLLAKDALEGWLEEQPERVASWVRASGFEAKLGQALVIPGEDGAPEAALAGFGDDKTRARGRFHLAGAAAKLPEGVYALSSDLEGSALEVEALGWLLAGYAFDRYAKASGIKARLVAPEGVDAAKIEAIAKGEALTRDLINTPASDMGPVALEAACVDLAGRFGAEISVIRGEALLEENFPMIHAVGRASVQVPRLIDMSWGDKGPKLTLVGKGVCFDTGGLNLKPGASMGLMKKDMGGAATVMGLAHMIMALGVPVQLRVLIPAVENAVSGDAFRPGDIMASRKGLSVEINNTDAEGRLVLGDALALGAEDGPDLMISMATLTGAARVAVGPDLSPYYSDDTGVVAALEGAAIRVADPVWRMPFWNPYEAMIEPGIADLDNAPKGGFAGSITAALFLRRFAGDKARYTHFDIYGWNPTAKPGRPKGGVGMGARAVLEALPGMLDL
ncbi:leucyl aminopeptidase family protein [Alisedimentitalea sp. MJ-SS2]|uniref:leucyl aminopeptidase family protein n=1 Tax=Aliisedimentitalea sp. MJ-SS2 TaxID=3049795 RepID=UPI0029084CB9|nr:leucyl aminopeptidase family protein [Alisedimentitalea sp. MJ-SS2]MDU8928173.1 leucyl aminopeptidase family protein [Alisedimentitalea sp. MJ-SS2]